MYLLCSFYFTIWQESLFCTVIKYKSSCYLQWLTSQHKSQIELPKKLKVTKMKQPWALSWKQQNLQDVETHHLFLDICFLSVTLIIHLEHNANSINRKANKLMVVWVITIIINIRLCQIFTICWVLSKGLTYLWRIVRMERIGWEQQSSKWMRRLLFGILHDLQWCKHTINLLSKKYKTFKM
jgi:hypothetical protein